MFPYWVVGSLVVAFVECSEGILTDGNSDRKDEYLAQPSYEHAQFLPEIKLDVGGLKLNIFEPKGGYGHGGYGGGYEHHAGHYDPLKGLLAPLAGVALLGAAALFITNPVLLQLGVVSGRRKRDVSNLRERLKDIHTIESFIEQLPHEQVKTEEKKLVAHYLQCSSSSGLGQSCLERLSCEMKSPQRNSTDLEKHVFTIVTSNMMKNEYVPTQLKLRVKKAEQIGAGGGKCERFYCSEIDSSNVLLKH